MAFGVTTDNIFSLLDEENEDPQALASKATAAQEPKAKKDAAAKPKDAAKPAVATGVEARMRGLATGDGAARGRGRGPPRGGFGGRGRGQYDRPAGDGDAIDAGSTPAANRGRSRGGRENGRGGRGGRGPREGQESRPPRRQYDRKDGTGRGNEMEKRGGAGRGNWGAEGEEIKEEADKVVSTEEAKPEEEAAPAEEPVAEEAAPPQGEEEKEMTLDEYEKMMEEKRANLNKPAAPKPTTSDEKAFEGMKAYTRKDLDEADDLENELELKNKKQIGVRKSGAIAKDLKPKETIKANFRVGDDGGNSGYSSRPRGGRSGRMGGGREGRNGPDRRDRPDREDRPPREDRPLREDRPYREDRPPREDRPQRSYNGPRNAGSRTGPAPSINDASAFPTLS